MNHEDQQTTKQLLGSLALARDHIATATLDLALALQNIEDTDTWRIIAGDIQAIQDAAHKVAYSIDEVQSFITRESSLPAE